MPIHMSNHMFAQMSTHLSNHMSSHISRCTSLCTCLYIRVYTHVYTHIHTHVYRADWEPEAASGRCVLGVCPRLHLAFLGPAPLLTKSTSQVLAGSSTERSWAPVMVMMANVATNFLLPHSSLKINAWRGGGQTKSGFRLCADWNNPLMCSLDTNNPGNDVPSLNDCGGGTRTRRKQRRRRTGGDEHGTLQIFVCVSTSDLTSTRKVLVDVRALAGVRLGVIQLACADLQLAELRGTRRASQRRHRRHAGFITPLQPPEGHLPWQAYQSDRTGGNGGELGAGVW